MQTVIPKPRHLIVGSKLHYSPSLFLCGCQQRYLAQVACVDHYLRLHVSNLQVPKILHYPRKLDE
jgi:hypothetical protein